MLFLRQILYQGRWQGTRQGFLARREILWDDGPSKSGSGGLDYGRMSAHPERLLGGSLVTFWPRSLAPQGETL